MTDKHKYLDGFIKQFKEELSDDDWKVSRFLDWLKLNNFEIIKLNMPNTCSCQKPIPDSESVEMCGLCGNKIKEL